MGDAETFHVVFVCTGNRFRSPLAAALFSRAAGELPVAVDSFGTLELEPMPALPAAVEEAARLGLDLSAHTSRPLAGANLTSADLVLGFERIHVARAVVDAHAKRERTFTLPELVALLPHRGAAQRDDQVGHARATVGAAAALRLPASPGTDIPEIHDPLGRPTDVARAIANDLSNLTERLVAVLFGR